MRHINLDDNLPRSKRSRNSSLKNKLLASFIIILFIVSFFLFISKQLFSNPDVVLSFFSSETKIKQDEGRINILFLGMGGGGHDGPDLTDTILVASFDPKTFDLALLSIPRDIWVDSLQTKINSAYAYGKEKTPNQGKSLSASAVGQVLGIPIHYVAAVDFSGFKKAVDLVGGVNIDVEKPFEDYQYPIENKGFDMCGYTEKIIEEATSASQSAGKIIYLDTSGNPPPEGVNPYACRFETLRFPKGPQLMNGETALKYVRSRKGTNGEGSDFARARRQQKLILALKEKILSVSTLVNPGKINELKNTFSDHIDTNITPEEAIQFYKTAGKIDFSQARTFVLSSEKEDSLLINPPPDQYHGAWVLAPKNGSWDEVHKFVRKFLFEEGLKLNQTP